MLLRLTCTSWFVKQVRKEAKTEIHKMLRFHVTCAELLRKNSFLRNAGKYIQGKFENLRETLFGLNHITPSFYRNLLINCLLFEIGRGNGISVLFF